jgi:hypothetical protein
MLSVKLLSNLLLKKSCFYLPVRSSWRKFLSKSSPNYLRFILRKYCRIFCCILCHWCPVEEDNYYCIQTFDRLPMGGLRYKLQDYALRMCALLSTCYLFRSPHRFFSLMINSRHWIMNWTSLINYVSSKRILRCGTRATYSVGCRSKIFWWLS